MQSGQDVGRNRAFAQFIRENLQLLEDVVELPLHDGVLGGALASRQSVGESVEEHLMLGRNRLFDDDGSRRRRRRLRVDR